MKFYQKMKCYLADDLDSREPTMMTRASKPVAEDPDVGERATRIKASKGCG